MKHGRKPTVAQRKHIHLWRLNPDNWLVVKDTIDYMVLMHRLSGKIRKIPGRGAKKDD